jgi:hypothetical protein
MFSMQISPRISIYGTIYNVTIFLARLSNKCKNIWHVFATFVNINLVFASEKYCHEESFLPHGETS